MRTHSTHTFFRFLRSLAQSVGPRAQAAGPCSTCGRTTPWLARMGFYRCLWCGEDPLHPAGTHSG